MDTNEALEKLETHSNDIAKLTEQLHQIQVESAKRVQETSDALYKAKQGYIHLVKQLDPETLLVLTNR